VIVGDSSLESKLKMLVEDIRKKYKFNIKFVIISEKQYTEMAEAKIYDFEKKVIWEK
jgi:hypothetical protein